MKVLGEFELLLLEGDEHPRAEKGLWGAASLGLSVDRVGLRLELWE